jgi:hypothetical protein
MGYHIKKIKKGVLGEISKIEEELDELKDSIDQNIKIMAAVELSDLYGAIEAYALKYHNLTMADISAMSDKTKSAFLDSTRR